MTKQNVHNYAIRIDAIKGLNARLREANGKGSKDCDAMLKSTGKFAFTETISKKIDSMGLNVDAIFSPNINPKVTKRFVQFMGAIAHDDVKMIDVTTATIIYALHLAGDNPLTIDALHYIAGGLKEGRISPELRGVSRMKVNKIFGRVGLSTVPTQASRTVGKNGFLQLVGATTGEPGKQNQKVSLNNSHPLIVAFHNAMNKATEGQIAEMVGE